METILLLGLLGLLGLVGLYLQLQARRHSRDQEDAGRR
jgi:hypothetical protein